ncbi:MAG: CmcJ/NvfI family oxidoreductase [Gammaproteobacteria bacterium]
MSQPLQAVDTELMYLAPGSFVNRRFVCQGQEVNTGRYEPYPVRIRDARPLRDEFTLDSHGFVLADHESRVQDFLDPAEVDHIYPAEAETVIRKLTGADKVVLRGWMVRTSADIPKENVTDYRHQGGVQPPAAEVHVDFSPECAERMARSTYEQMFPGDAPYQRFLITSLWRTFSPPPQDCPLALCDAGSVSAEEGTPNALVVVDEIPDYDAMVGDWPEEELTIQASIFRYSPEHRWWYFSGMNRDEVLLFKFHDSDHQRPWRVPHTSFFNSSAAGARTRQSIEVRSVAYFL